MDRSNKRKALLFMVAVLGIGLHILGFLFLQGMKIHFDSPKKAWFERQSMPGEQAVASQQEQERQVKRKEDLDAIFDRVAQRSSFVEKTQMDVLADLQNERFENDFTAQEMENLVNTHVDAISSASFDAVPIDESFISSQTEVMEKMALGPVEQTQMDPSVSLFSQDNDVARQLVQATRVLKGEVLVENVDSAALEGGIGIGLEEDSSIMGNAFQDRSGVLEAGADRDYPKGIGIFKAGAGGEEERSSHSLLSPLELSSSEFAYMPDSFQGDPLSFVRKSNSLGPGVIVDPTASVASSSDFHVDVVHTKRSDGQGYIFKLTFSPKANAKIKRIKQNMFFLLDRSHSINKVRYDFSRRAILKALALMNPGDSFNILVFDDQVVKLSEQSLLWSQENIEYARAFLSKQEHGGVFAATDIYASIGKIVPDVVAGNEVNTAILLSDGDTYLRRDRQRQTIAQWTKSNSGKVSLFCVASGKGNNLPLLQLLSAFNKGALVHATSDKMLESVLLRLVKSISAPVGKDIVVTAIASNEGTQVTVFPRVGQLPDLYEDQPYVIYGSTSRLEDFYVFLQGKYYDNWLDIKQKISFEESNKTDPTIEKNWTIYRAYDHYYRFLSDGDFAHLGMAKSLLQPLNVQMAFQ